jgi:hypothetical protein
MARGHQTGGLIVTNLNSAQFQSCGFPEEGIRLAIDRRYDQAEVVFRAATGDDIGVAQRVMNLRWLRKCLEKQGKLQEAADVVSLEFKLAASTSDPALLSNVMGSASTFVLSHGNLATMSQLFHILADKMPSLVKQVSRPFEFVCLSSATSYLVANVTRKILRENVRGTLAEKEHVAREAHSLAVSSMQMSSFDALHQLQTNPGVTNVVPFSHLLVHFELATFERRHAMNYHFGLAPHEWLDVARDRALNFSDTSLAGSDQDWRRLYWLMFATMTIGHEGGRVPNPDVEYVESSRLGMVARAEAQLATDVLDQSNLYLKAREIEDFHGLDWPYYEDHSLISDYF